MALAGHSGSHNVQSMHSSGSITRKFGPSWKQSTGHTSTQSVYLHLMQFSVTTNGMVVLGDRFSASASRSRNLLASCVASEGSLLPPEAQAPECTQMYMRMPSIGRLQNI